MLDNQVLDPFSGVHEELATAFDGPYERIFARQAAKANPLEIPAGEARPAAHDQRTSLLSGLAAVAITVALFAAGIAAVIAPAPALAVPAHTILL
jgi:hypothetical protein